MLRRSGGRGVTCRDECLLLARLSPDQGMTQQMRTETSDRLPRRRDPAWITVGLLVGFGLTISLLSVICAPRERAHRVVTSPESGYQFPPLAGISEMYAGYAFPSGCTQFAVPLQYWGEILDALSPSESDDDPPPWTVLGGLEMKIQNGDRVVVQLYSTGDETTGAFSAGPTFELRGHFRGGNTRRLQAALVKAYEAFLGDSPKPQERKGTTRQSPPDSARPRPTEIK